MGIGGMFKGVNHAIACCTNASRDLSATGEFVVDLCGDTTRRFVCAAPADIEAPTALEIMSDGSVLLRLLPALDATVTRYYVVVVPEDLAQSKRPQDFTLDEVCVWDASINESSIEIICRRYILKVPVYIRQY